MRSSCCRALLVLLLIVVTGCAAGGDRLPRRTGLLMEPGEAGRLGYVPNWSVNLEVPRNDRLIAAEVLGDLLVTVEEPSNLVTAVSLRDGSIRWRQVIGTDTQRLHTPARSGNRILVNSDTRLYLLNAANGRVEEVADLDRVVAMGPLVREGMAIYGGIDGTAFAHDIDAGFATWRYQLTDRILVPPVAVGENNVLLTDARGVYALVTVLDGELRWRGRTFGAITAKPAVDAAAVYVASNDRSLYALSRGSGDDHWPAPYRARQALTESPMSFDLVVLQPLPGTGVVALDSVDGTVRWQLDEAAFPITRYDEDHAILATSRSLLQVSLTSGNVVSRSESQRLSTVLTGPDDSLILVSPTGRMMRMNPAR